LFYHRLFELDPSLQRLFHDDMPAQGRKLMTMLGFIVARLHHPEVIVPTIQELGRRHAAYGVQEDHYTTVGAAWLWTLRHGLGTQFTPAVEAAWAEAYSWLTDTMQAASEASMDVAQSALVMTSGSSEERAGRS
jgi:hemoglobin-like flavoprotein